MSWSMFLFVMKQLAMEKKCEIPHEETLYLACKNFILCNPDRIKNYFIGCVEFAENQALDIELLLNYFWRY